MAILELAYFSHRRFALIDENGGYFVSRVKDRTNPVITDGMRELRAIPLEGKKIQDVVDDLHHHYIDVEVEVSFQRRECAGTQSWDTKRFRVVGVLVADADDCHLSITNLPRSGFVPCDLAPIYRCRWEVELLFRELKTRDELDEFETMKKHIVEILVYEVLLTFIPSRTLLGSGHRIRRR